MKRWLVTVAILVTMFLVGCTTNPAPQQGQTGAQGQAGQSGQQGAQGQSGQSGQQGAEGQSGQTGQTGDPGQTGQTGQTGAPAACPAGQHRYTDPATGVVRCVRD